METYTRTAKTYWSRRSAAQYISQTSYQQTNQQVLHISADQPNSPCTPPPSPSLSLSPPLLSDKISSYIIHPSYKCRQLKEHLTGRVNKTPTINGSEEGSRGVGNQRTCIISLWISLVGFSRTGPFVAGAGAGNPVVNEMEGEL